MEINTNTNTNTNNNSIVLSLYSKDQLNIKDANQYYATSLNENQPVPTICSNKLELQLLQLKLQNEVENSGDGNNDKNEKLYVVLKDFEDNSSDEEKEEKDMSEFDLKRYFNNLKTLLFGHDIIHSKVISSTQTIATKYFRSTRQGLTITADQQTNGIGRGANTFKSPKGCLLYSFKLKLAGDSGSKLPFLQYIIGVAMVNAIKSFPIAKDLNVQLKWPNDIYVNSENADVTGAASGWKLGGILCTSSFDNQEFDIVAGVGINCTNTNNPTTTLNQFIHEKQQQQSSSSSSSSSTTKSTESIKGEGEAVDIPIYISRDQLLARFFNEFEPMFIKFTKEGFNAEIKSKYLNYWMHSNQIVKLQEKENQFAKIIGLAENGFLEAIDCDENGNSSSPAQRNELHPDGTSFDLKNLVLMKKQQQPQPQQPKD